MICKSRDVGVVQELHTLPCFLPLLLASKYAYFKAFLQQHPAIGNYNILFSVGLA